MKNILVSFVLLASSATSVIANNDDKDNNTLTEAEKQVMLESDFQMPSAAALVNALSKKIGKVDWNSLIVPVGKNKYTSIEDKVLNLGVRGADAYFLNNSQDSSNLIAISTEINYLLNTIIFNNKSFNNNIRKAKLKKLKDLVTAKKWKMVQKKIGELQDSISNDFIEAKLEHLNLLNNVGGWIEGYRLAVEGIKANYKLTSTDVLLQDELISYLIKELKADTKLKSFSKTAQLLKTLNSINAILNKTKDYQLSKRQVDNLSKVLAETKKYI